MTLEHKVQNEPTKNHETALSPQNIRDKGTSYPLQLYIFREALEDLVQPCQTPYGTPSTSHVSPYKDILATHNPLQKAPHS